MDGVSVDAGEERTVIGKERVGHSNLQGGKRGKAWTEAVECADLAIWPRPAGFAGWGPGRAGRGGCWLSKRQSQYRSYTAK